MSFLLFAAAVSLCAALSDAPNVCSSPLRSFRFKLGSTSCARGAELRRGREDDGGAAPDSAGVACACAGEAVAIFLRAVAFSLVSGTVGTADDGDARGLCSTSSESFCWTDAVFAARDEAVERGAALTESGFGTPLVEVRSELIELGVSCAL
eukprot:6180590-Pleurochrysis_carterae.AAC.1